MSLYDDVEDGIDQQHNNQHQQYQQHHKDIASWSSNSSFKLLEAQLQAKKHQQQLSLNRREKPAIAPVIDLSSDKRKRKESTSMLDEANVLQPKIEKSDNLLNISNNSDEKSQVLPIYATNGEEYDPLKPNDYEQLIEDLKKRKLYTPPTHSSHTSDINDKEKPSSSRNSSKSRDERKSSNSRSSRHHSDHSRRHDDHRKSSSSSSSSTAVAKDNLDSSGAGLSFRPRYDDEDYENDDYKNELKQKRSNMGAAFAPPASLLEDSSNNNNNNNNKKSDSEEYESPFQKNESKSNVPGIRSAVEKMMEKMGYKEGEGLGRNKQGMSVALQVEKIGRHTGRIIHEKDASKEVAPKDKEAAQQDLMKNPSKVILLKNMVGPGEVDADLEGETKEECQKYGEVNKVVIFEIPETTPDEAVRIFIEFKTLPSAIKALVDLNGRYFGGRIVKATFYNFDKFRSYNLGDDA